MKRRTALILATLVIGGWSFSAKTGTAQIVIAEFFNGYVSDGPVNTKGAAGNGWQAGWTGSVLPKYQSGSQLNYFAPGFSQAGNDTDPVTSGLAHSGAPGEFHLPNPDGVNPNSVVVRSLQPLTGTIWISAVTVLDDGFPIIGDGQGTLLWLEPDAAGDAGANYIGIRSDLGSSSGLPEPIVEYADAVDAANNTSVSRGPGILMLARITIDAGGSAFDSVDFWVNPDLTTGPAGLDAQAIYSKSGVDVFGTSFDRIGFSFAGGLNLIDCIRISDELVGVVPEPSAFLLAAFGGLLLGLIRCSRR